LPSGEIHYKFFKRGYLVEIPLSLLLIPINWKFALGNIVGYSFHRFCDNDMDIQGVSACEGRAVNEIPILGHFMFGVSSAYGSIFRRHHRSFITHFPYVSTLIRLVFFFTFPLLLFDNMGINLIGNGWHMFWLGFYNGLSCADGIHWWLDKTFKGE